MSAFREQERKTSRKPVGCDNMVVREDVGSSLFGVYARQELWAHVVRLLQHDQYDCDFLNL